MGVLFKAPSSLQELNRINCGLFYGYSQVGKFITIYPKNDQEAVWLAQRLHKLTFGISAPAVPFDRQFRAGSPVYYRYGAFSPLEMENPDGTRVLAIKDPEGKLIPDRRDAAASPVWAPDPFAIKQMQRKAETVDSPLKTTFRAFNALSRRGKGGVYQAVDLSISPPRLCILKEGRAGGEVSWDGRDGNWRVRNEKYVLDELHRASIAVPRIYASFEVEGNYYLAMELIEGEDLQSLLRKRRRRLAIVQALRYGIQLSLLISRIHAAGWVWRDCKLANLIVTKRDELRPLDFEGACPVDYPDPVAWNTPDFAPPESKDEEPLQSRAPEDFYALGAMIYLLITGKLPQAPLPIPDSEIEAGCA